MLKFTKKYLLVYKQKYYFIKLKELLNKRKKNITKVKLYFAT